MHYNQYHFLSSVGAASEIILVYVTISLSPATNGNVL